MGFYLNNFKSLMSRAKAVFADVDVATLHFTHARVRPYFSGCGRRLEETLSMIDKGEMDISSLPIITILHNGNSDDYYFSLNNRRLWVIKQLHERGFFDGGKKLKVRMKEALPRERERYTKEKCSLSARIMKEKESVDDENENEDEDEDSMLKVASLSIDSKFPIPAAAEDATTVFTKVSETVEIISVVKAASATVAKTAKPKKPAAIPSNVLKSLPNLVKEWKKGSKKGKQLVRSHIDEWISSNVLAPNQEDAVIALIESG